MTVYESEYFQKYELRCSHCNRAEMELEFMDRLDSLRETLSKPIYLNSAYRCPEHNNNVSNTGNNGPHTTGKSVDISAYGNRAWEILRIAMVMEFKGIGLSQKGEYKSRFIHIDDLDCQGRPWVWSY